MTIDELKKIFPDATPETWHQHPNGGGWVQNTATAAESAFVGPNARVSGYAQVFGNARVSSPIQIQGSMNFINEASATLIQIGCMNGTAAWWAKHRVKLGQKNGYTAERIEEYRLYLKLIADVRRLRNRKKRTKATKATKATAARTVAKRRAK